MQEFVVRKFYTDMLKCAFQTKPIPNKLKITINYYLTNLNNSQSNNKNININNKTN